MDGPFVHILKKHVFQIFEKKIPPPPAAVAPGGRRRRRRQGYFFKMCLKMDRIFKHLFENGLYLARPIFKVAIRHFFSNFQHLVGDASYQVWTVI